MGREGLVLRYKGRMGVSRDEELKPHLSIIRESNQSGEKASEDEEDQKLPLNLGDTDMQFDFEEQDERLERIEIIASRLDIHRNGTLYLKEIVSYQAEQHRRLGCHVGTAAEKSETFGWRLPSFLPREDAEGHDVGRQFCGKHDQGAESQ